MPLHQYLGEPRCRIRCVIVTNGINQVAPLFVIVYSMRIEIEGGLANHSSVSTRLGIKLIIYGLHLYLLPPQQYGVILHLLDQAQGEG